MLAALRRAPGGPERASWSDRANPAARRARSARRRSPVWVLLVIGAVLLALFAAEGLHRASPQPTGAPPSCAASPLQARELARLAQFTSWLAHNDAAGYVGEVGWPSGQDAAAWNRLASSWYGAATAANLWITAWSASQWWPAGYPMAVYRLPSAGFAGSSGTQTAVTDLFPASRGSVHGIDVPTGAFGTADDGDAGYSNRDPGVFGVDYSYESATGFQFLAQRGVTTVRLSITWERLQPEPGGELDPAALAQLIQAINRASQAALHVIIDLHGFGGYWSADGGAPTRLALGSEALPASRLADFWSRMSIALKDTPGITGYGLMNEPGKLAADSSKGTAIWEDASQQAVTAIRATGDTRTILVSGYGGSSPEGFGALQPHAWIVDPARNMRYEVHQYFDSARSGRYALTYAQEEASAALENRCGS